MTSPVRTKRNVQSALSEVPPSAANAPSGVTPSKPVASKPVAPSLSRPVPLPASVKIGATRWRVSSGELEDDYGITFKRDTRIVLARRQSSDNLRDTTMHEVLHALLETSGVLRGEVPVVSGAEETLVAVLSPWVLALLRENPDLVAFLMAVDP